MKKTTIEQESNDQWPMTNYSNFKIYDETAREKIYFVPQEYVLDKNIPFLWTIPAPCDSSHKFGAKYEPQLTC